LVEHSYTGAYEEHCVPDKKRFRSMLRLAYGLFDQVVAVSYGQAAWLRSADLVPFDRLTTIRQCSDLTAFLNVPSPRAHSGPLRLGSYGRLVAQKGYDILIEAMRLVDPDNAVLHLAGHGPDAELLLTQAAGLSHVFIDTAFVNPVHFLAEVDAIILPSRWEAYGVVAVESRAAGRPILVSDVDGLSEQTRDGAGFCMDASSPQAIATAIECLVRQDFPSLVNRARRSVNSHFEHFIQEWRNLTTDLLQSHSAGEPEIQFSLSVTEELARLGA
jgi:glycosyltransferase involved in cell wall biosynthesis